MKRKWVRYLLLIPALLVVLVVLSAASNVFFPRSSKLVDRLSAEEKARAAEVIHLRQELGNEVWPGFGDAAIPLVLFNEAYAFLLNYEGEPPIGWTLPRSGEQQGTAWEPVPGDDFLGEPYYRQRLIDDVTPQAFCVRLGDQWAASMTTYEWSRVRLAQLMKEELPSWLGPVVPYFLVTRLYIGDTDKYVSAVTHESFHAYVGLQSERRLIQAEEAARRQEENYPWEDETIIAGWQTELELLTQAVRASSREETVDLVRQFLSARAERRENNRLATRLIDYEQRREWLEGLAKYVELEAWRQGATAPDYSAHPAAAELSDFHGYEGFETAWTREVDQITRTAEDSGDTRFYYSGMAQATLLDRLMPGWKEGALTGGTTLEGLLAAAIDV
ncbi:MAG: hypothetical protein GX579_15080 [Chloroflexi bacterium]|nr:hypothetical protein [Chloroflexota bacterium]